MIIRAVIIGLLLVPQAYAFTCKQADVADMQLMTEDELIQGFCINEGFVETNRELANLWSSNPSFRDMQKKDTQALDGCVAVTQRYNLVYRSNFGSELSSERCAEWRAKRSGVSTSSSPDRPATRLTKQQRLDELTSQSLSYEEYQRRYKEIMASQD